MCSGATGAGSRPRSPSCTLGDRLRPEDDLDLIVIGSGGEAQQRLIADDLAEVKGPGIREAVVAGRAAALAVGGGYELFRPVLWPGSGGDLPAR